MKNLYVTVLLIALCAFSYQVHSQNFAWAKKIGGLGSDQSRDITLDANGNIYTTGAFTTTVDFDPGPGIFNLTPHGFQSDIFLSKLDASGNLVWARAFGGMNNDYGMSVAVDVFGNVYMTGSFHDSADFDPGPGVFNLVAQG